GFLVYEAAIDQWAKQRVKDPELLHLPRVDRGAELRPQALEGGLQGLLQILGPDVAVADGSDDGIGRMARVIIRPRIDAPEPERDDQEREQGLDDDRTGSAPDPLHHGAKCPIWRGSRPVDLRKARCDRRR